LRTCTYDLPGCGHCGQTPPPFVHDVSWRRVGERDLSHLAGWKCRFAAPGFPGAVPAASRFAG
jgi:hypothetical protein